ncbi:hypothetical protein AAZX31_02G030100 [Glycine max]|uniref:uncharacterized protein LOC114379989 n=1 Tax=Glycine soja TaxID=3848 RepID=UPI00103FAE6C|nr:uncharacterized protein LOC114379989 [Glycine soja]KAG5078994.1 hypothetical protein JHK86_003059 [Glycine max]KAH1260058.1 hypothetical protein GmHk_02G003281 [Glycine max]KAH1260059.1 hypothetical protein GmHk_02G003281 [Glycine max]
MAAASSTLFSFSFPFDPQIQTLSFPLSSAKPRFSPKPFSTFKLTSTHSSSSSSLTVSDDPFNTGRFLSNDELRRLRLLETFLYRCDLPSGGSLSVRVMRPHETDPTVLLLAASFAESMLLPQPYVKFLAFLVKQYLLDRRSLMPHTATLVAFYTQTAAAAADQDQEQEQEARLAGTVELSFDIRGANATVPSPTPPRDKPYICNMAVRKSLRRRGIGWHLLRASEELISQMSSAREVYLHCRIIDEAPFNMYTKADYKIVKTDSILVLLTLQRRKHLMCKKLPLLSTPPETDLSVSDEQKTM